MSSPILVILRAAHCRSTHHHIAVDALDRIATKQGRRLVTQLLRHHMRYLTGAKDPDVRFRDFQNHVIHVDDGYWGGAPRVASQWYDRLQKYLRQARYADAAHAAGVLSHYFTDPMMPLHTAQSPVEKVLHRPIEWSVTKSYGSLIQRWRDDPTRTVFELSDQPGWLGESMLYAARLAHAHYSELLNQYDLAAGSKQPPSGLNEDLQTRLSDLLGLAVTGWARVLERVAWEADQSGVTIPRASVTLGTVLAGVRVPDRLWIRRVAGKRQQSKVSAMVEEFRRTGDVVESLPSEQRIIARVRKIRHRERDYRARRELAARLAADEKRADESDDTPRAILPFATAARQEDDVDDARIRLQVIDPLVHAPSIGPKTADRFSAIGIHTVGDFLSADVLVTANRLATGWITAETLMSWRNQCLLMCQLPDMLARDVKLLVAVGAHTVDIIAATDEEALHSRLVAMSETAAGARLLRGGRVPDRDRVAEFIDDAMEFVQRQTSPAESVASKQRAA